MERVKCAKEAGLSLSLVLKEEVRYKEQIEREERQKERDLKREELEVQERERQRENEANEAKKQRVHELALAGMRPEKPFSKW